MTSNDYNDSTAIYDDTMGAVSKASSASVPECVDVNAAGPSAATISTDREVAIPLSCSPLATPRRHDRPPAAPRPLGAAESPPKKKSHVSETNPQPLPPPPLPPPPHPPRQYGDAKIVPSTILSTGIIPSDSVDSLTAAGPSAASLGTSLVLADPSPSVMQYAVAHVDASTGRKSVVQFTGTASQIAMEEQLEAMQQQLMAKDVQLQEQAQYLTHREGHFLQTETQYRHEATEALDHIEVHTIRERAAATQAAQAAEMRAASSRHEAVSAREAARKQATEAQQLALLAAADKVQYTSKIQTEFAEAEERIYRHVEANLA